MTNIVRKDYKSLCFDIKSEYWIIYDIDNIKGITKIIELDEAHEDRKYRVIEKNGTIIEASTIKTFYNMRGDIAYDEVEYIKQIHNL